MVEDFSPLLNGSNVSIHAFTSLDSIWKHPDDLTNIFNPCDKPHMFEVIENMFNLFEQGICAVEAVLELIQMVVSGQAVNESSDKVRDCIHRWKVNMGVRVHVVDWSQKIDQGSCSVIASIEEISSVPVLLFHMNSLLDFRSMEEPSLVY